MPEAGPRSRDRLVLAATRLLDDGGPENVTLREVGRLTGVSRTAPYRHFASKADLLATVAARELDHLVDVVERSADDRDPAARLEDAMLGYLRWARERPQRFRLVFGHWTEENDDLRRAAARANGVLVALVEAAQSTGGQPPDDPWRAAAAVRAFVHGVAVLEQNGHLLGRDREPLSAEHLVRTFRPFAPGSASVSAPQESVADA